MNSIREAIAALEVYQPSNPLLRGIEYVGKEEVLAILSDHSSPSREELKESILHYLGEVYEDSNLGEIADRILSLVRGPVTTFRYSPLEPIPEDTPEDPLRTGTPFDDYEEIAAALSKLGWRASNDAQWEHLREWCEGMRKRWLAPAKPAIEDRSHEMPYRVIPSEPGTGHIHDPDKARELAGLHAFEAPAPDAGSTGGIVTIVASGDSANPPAKPAETAAERVAIYLHNWCVCHVDMDICRKSAVEIIRVIGGTP